MVIIRWFLSRRVRHALDVGRQVRKLVCAQRDRLSPASIQQVEAAVQSLQAVVAAGGGSKEIEVSLDGLEKAVNQHLQPYPHPRWRENVEVFLVTGAIVLALRTFFFQPMAIPSGSAQPTLWGIEVTDYRGRPEVQFPTGLRRWVDEWWSGISYKRIVAEDDGELSFISQPQYVFPFVRRQTLQVTGRSYAVYFSSSLENLARRQGRDGAPLLREEMKFNAGDDILKAKVVSGDHLFVNRMVYNFRRPRRGEIIVFSSAGIPRLIPNTHYIKRLVAIGGDRVRIGNDRHLIINGHRLDASTPGFENVYGFNPKEPPQVDRYSGHVNGLVAKQYTLADLAGLFPDERAEFTVRPGHCLAMGDNTMNSFDGRSWGDFPQEKVIGKAGFVFWPITSRFGWGYR